MMRALIEVEMILQAMAQRSNRLPVFRSNETPPPWVSEWHDENGLYRWTLAIANMPEEES